jgi:hypothetical protein
MVDQQEILTAIVGPEGAKALRKAAERLPHLDHAMLPRALYSWLALAGHGYDGPIPGLGGHLLLRKTESGFRGAMSAEGTDYAFESASLLHVAAALGVFMGLDHNRVPASVSDSDLAKLGKSLDALVGARVAHEALKKMTASFDFHLEHDVTGSPQTVVYATDDSGKPAGKAVLVGSPQDLALHALDIDRQRYPGLEKKMIDVVRTLVGFDLQKAEKGLPPHALMSAENPLFPQTKSMSNQEAVQYLRNSGEDAHSTIGSYGRPENSLIVYRPKNPKLIEDLSRDLGQESVIHSDGSTHQMLMVNGPNAGKHHPGQGTEWHAEKPQDYYTILPDGRIFTHNFDFNQLHSPHDGLEKAGEGEAEAPGPAHKPTPQAGPLQPEAPTRQQDQPPMQRGRKPPAPLKATMPLPSLRLSEKQLTATCTACGGSQCISSSGRFVSCFCFRDLAADVKLQKQESSYLLSFGGKWDEDVIFAFLDTIRRGKPNGQQ